MNSVKYKSKNYLMCAMEINEIIMLNKLAGNDHSWLYLMTNNDLNGDIRISSQAMAEQLHFMLGQMLGK